MIYKIIFFILVWVNLVFLYQARVVFNTPSQEQIGQNTNIPTQNNTDQSESPSSEMYNDVVGLLPKVNTIEQRMDTEDSRALTEEAKIELFQEEAFCKITRGTVVQADRGNKVELSCPARDFYPVWVQIEKYNGQRMRVSGVIYEGAGKCMDSEGWWGWAFWLPDDVLQVWNSVYNVVLDKNYYVLYRPFLIGDLHESGGWRQLSTQKIDISHLPECEPNL